MITSKLCVVSEGAIRDEQSHMVTAINILDDITPVGMPLLLPKLFFCALWVRQQGDPANVDGEFLVTLNDRTLFNRPVTLNFGTTSRHWTLVNLQGLVVQEPGELAFSVRVEGHQTARYDLSVQVPNPTIQPTS